LKVDAGTFQGLVRFLCAIGKFLLKPSIIPVQYVELLFVCCRPNQSLELTALKHRGSARKGKEEFALSGLGRRLLAAAQVGR
jgi:hypothetical protein